MAVCFHPSERQAQVDLHPSLLPCYAARSCLRMFVGLAISLWFISLQPGAGHVRLAEVGGDD
jgi:hypothetical protein